MKNFLIILAIVCVSLSCKQKETEAKPEVATQEVAINYQSFGEEITDEGVLVETEALEKYNAITPGDTINIKFSTKVNSVCQNKGCWMRVAMGEEEAMVKFKDYAFFMPKDIAGQEVIVEGRAFVEEMSVEDQRHFAEDAGKPEDEIAAITERKRTLSFEANGVLIPELEKE